MDSRKLAAAACFLLVQISHSHDSSSSQRKLLCTCADGSSPNKYCTDTYDDDGNCYSVGGGENCDHGGGPTNDICVDTCSTCVDDDDTPTDDDTDDTPTASPTMTPASSPTMAQTSSPTMTPASSPTVAQTSSPTFGNHYAFIGVQGQYDQAWCDGSIQFWDSIDIDTLETITLSSSLGESFTCSTTNEARAIVDAYLISASTATSVTCDDHAWNMGSCSSGAPERSIGIDASYCACDTALSWRPCIGNNNWGGTSCYPATQELVISITTTGNTATSYSYSFDDGDFDDDVTGNSATSYSYSFDDDDAVYKSEGIINGVNCEAVIFVGQHCDPGDPHYDPEGMVCANDDTPEEAYCSYDIGSSACARCETSNTATSYSYSFDDGDAGTPTETPTFGVTSSATKAPAATPTATPTSKPTLSCEYDMDCPFDNLYCKCYEYEPSTRRRKLLFGAISGCDGYCVEKE